jgi:hypothetical protein
MAVFIRQEGQGGNRAYMLIKTWEELCSGRHRSFPAGPALVLEAGSVQDTDHREGSCLWPGSPQHKLGNCLGCEDLRFKPCGAGGPHIPNTGPLKFLPNLTFSEHLPRG